jgi:sortase A
MKTLVIILIALAFVVPAGAATINIPAIHVHEQVTANLDAGPAWWTVTGRPGGGDTVAIAGHRTTHTRPFHDLDKLKPGDRIYVRWSGRSRAYVVTSRRVVSVHNLHIGDAVGHERLVLTACARRDGTPTSASWRIVVYALPVTQAR